MADLISRSALMRHIENEYREWGEEYDALQILGDIEDAPSIEAEPIKHGEWIESWGGKWHSCSVCGGIPPFNFKGEDIITSYCPHCGARMDGGENG
jgi:hypothetical protein